MAIALAKASAHPQQAQAFSADLVLRGSSPDAAFSFRTRA
jgi:hypothetical protein